MNNKQHSILYNFVMRVGIKILGAACAAISYPIAYRALGASAVGKVAFATSVTSFFSMIGVLGIPTYGVRECSKARGDKEQLKRVVNELINVQIRATLVAAALLAVAICLIPKFRDNAGLILMDGAVMLLSMLGMEWLYEGMERYDYLTLRTAIPKILGVALIAFLVHRPTDYLLYALLLLLPTVCILATDLLTSRGVCRLQLERGIDWRRHIVPTLLFFGQTVAITIYTNLDSVMLGFLSGDFAVGIYDSAVKLKLILSYFVTSLGAVMFPRLSYYASSGQDEAFLNGIRRSTEFVVLVGLLLSFFFFLMPGESIELIFGSEYIAATDSFRVLTLAIFLIGCSTITGMQILMPLGGERKVLRALIAGAVTDVLLNLILIPRYGALGAALGTLAAEVVVLGVELFYLGSWRGVLLRASQIWRIGPATAAACGVLLLFKRSVQLSPFTMLACGVTLYVAVGIGLLIALREPMVMQTLRFLTTRLARLCPDNPTRLPDMRADTPSNNRVWFRLIYVLIAVLSVLFMIWHAEDTGFWFDEYGQLAYSAFGRPLLESVLILDPTPPLFTLIANLWCRLVPYGQRWLLLLPQLFVGLAVYTVGLWGERLRGGRAGVCGAALLGLTQMAIEQCGFEFRSYALYLFFAALSAYVLTRRLTGEDRQGLRWAHALALTGLLYAHLFGALLALAQFFVELALAVRKKTPWKNLLLYAGAGLLFLPWAMYFAISTMRQLVQTQAQWMTVPSVWDMAKLIAYLCANNIVYLLLFVLGCAGAVYTAYRRRDDRAALACVTPLWYILLMTVLVFAFSVIRADYATLWVKRYFTGLFPCAAVLAALGLDTVAAAAGARNRFRALPIVLSGLLLLPVIPVSLYKTATGDTPLTPYYHREAAQLLLEQADIRAEDTIVLSTLGDFTEAWQRYTVEEDGRRDSFEARSLYELGELPLDRYRVVYVDDGFPGFPEERERAMALLAQTFKRTNEWESEHVIRYVRE